MNTNNANQNRAIEANKVKELVVRTLISEGYLTKERGEDFLAKFAIVEHQRGWLGSTIDKLLPKDSRDAYYRIIKILF